MLVPVQVIDNKCPSLPPGPVPSVWIKDCAEVGMAAVASGLTTVAALGLYRFVTCVAPTVVTVEAFPFKAAVIVPALKLPEPSRATIVDAVFALVALDVTVNVALVDWLAVKVCDPDRPVPDTFMVSVPLLTLAAVVAVLALPFRLAVMVPALKLPDASRATTLLAVLAEVASTANVTAPEPL